MSRLPTLVRVITFCRTSSTTAGTPASWRLLAPIVPTAGLAPLGGNTGRIHLGRRLVRVQALNNMGTSVTLAPCTAAAGVEAEAEAETACALSQVVAFLCKINVDFSIGHHAPSRRMQERYLLTRAGARRFILLPAAVRRGCPTLR